MARRQHKLGVNAVNVDTAKGVAVPFDLVRVDRFIYNPMNKRASIIWEIGRLNAGVWERSTANGHRGVKTYVGNDFDKLIGVATPAAMEDKVYIDLVADALIRSGVQEDYPA